jgi:ribosomal protein L11 methyltransferase
LTTYLALRFRVPVALEEDLQGFMLTLCDVQGIEENSGETIFYVSGDDWSASQQASLDEFVIDNKQIRFLGREEMEQRDWNAEWEASIQPERATDRLVISPSWHKDQAEQMGAEQLIVIDPKMSFGTGHHETTRLCLRAIESLDCKDRSVLDLGTGTGVLAIYALMLGARHAVAVDTDEWSIQNAHENRLLNHIDESQLEIRSGTLASVVSSDEQFEIVIANIHRNVLLEIADDLHKHTMKSTTLILSGLLVYDGEEVQARYVSAGFRFVRQTQENEWISLTFSAN